MEVFREGYVYIRDESSEETVRGYSVSYDSGYLDCLDAALASLTLLLRRESDVSDTLFTFFDGLIPEGWLLDIATCNCKIDVRDRFGLLLVAFHEGIGNVRIEEMRR